jgi:hypothetical protein
MASRANLGIIAWLGIILVVGLIVTHSAGSNAMLNTASTGLNNIFRDLTYQTGQTVGGH